MSVKDPDRESLPKSGSELLRILGKKTLGTIWLEPGLAKHNPRAMLLINKVF